jgi:SAM-dependent methyltransferase
MVAVVDFAKKAGECLTEKPHASILDIGCGDGRDAAYFTSLGHHVTAIDFSEEAIARVRARTTSIDARVMETQSINFPDVSFDAIYAHLSLHYFDDTTTNIIIKNIRRMLKPGGFFFVRCKSTKDPGYRETMRADSKTFRLR